MKSTRLVLVSNNPSSITSTCSVLTMLATVFESPEARFHLRLGFAGSVSTASKQDAWSASLFCNAAVEACQTGWRSSITETRLGIEFTANSSCYAATLHALLLLAGAASSETLLTIPPPHATSSTAHGRRLTTLLRALTFLPLSVGISSGSLPPHLHPRTSSQLRFRP